MKKIIIPIIILIILILGPTFFFKDGIYFFLDTIFYPINKLNGFFTQSFYWHIRDLLTIVFGYKLYAKIFILTVLIVGIFLGISLGKLVSFIFKIKDKDIYYIILLFGIIFTLFNPFIYERLVTQTGIALGTFFIGLGLVYLIFYFIKNENKYLYFSSLFFGVSLNIYPHAIVMISIIGIISLLFYFKKFNIKSLLIGFIIFLGLNINWLIGTFFFSENNIISNINNFNTLNIEVFKSNSLSHLGVELTQLLGYGFWGERYHHLYTPDLINKRWYIAGFIIFFMVVVGFFLLYKENKRLSLYFLSLGIISYILSLGISSDIFVNFNKLLYKYIPYYIGMREPEKILGLTMIIYVIFFLITLVKLLKLFSNYIKKYKLNERFFNIYTFLLFIFSIIWAWSPNMLFGFNGQLKITSYPDDYNKIQKLLYKKEKIIVFPWHSYVACSWTYGKVISNPAKAFFHEYNIISADNIEIGQLYTNSKSLLSKQIEKFLYTKNYNILLENNISYILFMKDCADFKNYIFLNNSSNLSKVFSGTYLDLYKIGNGKK